MHYQEKRALLSAFSSILILGLYSWYIYHTKVEGNPDIINSFKFWGKAFITLIPVTILAQIVIHIVFIIINKIVTNEDAPKITDERDKLIELKTIRISHWVFIVGFLLSMGSQAIEMKPYVMFIILIYSGFVAAVVSDFAKVYYYRKGM